MTAPHPDTKAIAEAVHARREWAVGRLGSWVRFPSMLLNEQPAQEYIAGVVSTLGFDTKLEPIDVDRISKLPGFSPVDWSYDGRTNVVGIHEPKNPKGRSLIINGHVDVVSPAPYSVWKTDPFVPHIVENEEDGETWMYGRGAADMKGGTMSCLWALAALQDLGYEPASKVIFQSPLEEECTGNGALALADAYRADAALIPEPFNETLLCRQVGVMWFDVRITGKTTHVLGAGAGVNAIEKSWIIIQAMREMEKELNDPKRIPATYAGNPHPINLNVGTISGGDWASTVAGECVTRFRIGTFPGESLEEMKKRIEKKVAEAAQADEFFKHFPPLVEYIGFQAEGCEFDAQSDFGRAIVKHHSLWRGHEPECLSSTATTDVRFFNLYYNTPATCYGPKSRNIHSADEKVSIDSMHRVAEVVASFIGDWCGVRKRSA